MQRKGSLDHLSDCDIEESASLLGKSKNKNISFSVFLLSHLACVAVQVIFGCGSPIGRYAFNGKSSVPSLIFAMYREGFAGLIMFIVYKYLCKTKSIIPFQKQDIHMLLYTGLAMYGNQALMVLGLSKAPAVIGSLWQTSQPAFTIIIAILIKIEKSSKNKIIGIALSMIGAFSIVIIEYYINPNSTSDGNNINTNKKSDILIGSLFFFGNCLSSSLYVILSKKPLKKYSAITVCTFSYLIAFVLMTITCTYYISNPSLFIIPKNAILPLLYWIFFSSVAGYFLMTLANNYLDASIVSCYSTLQPLVSAIVAYPLLGEKIDMSIIGGVGIFAGLYFIVKGSKSEDVN